MFNRPIAYFLTFSTYGSRLHGDERGSVLKQGKRTKIIDRNDGFKTRQSDSLRYPVVLFNQSQRRTVLDTIIKHLEFRGWHLYAAHVRNNHVHVILDSNENPDKVMSQLKAWATRKLRQAGHDFEKVWTRHGSTKYIYTQSKLEEKVHYVVYEQGEMMEYYIEEK